MSNFIIQTDDAIYSYDVNDSVAAKAAEVSFKYESNMQESTTQGYLVKQQKGRFRIVAEVYVIDSKARLEANLLPQWQYSGSLAVTFDRNLPGKNTTSGNFLMRSYEITREIVADGDQEVKVLLVEVIDS